MAPRSVFTLICLIVLSAPTQAQLPIRSWSFEQPGFGRPTLRVTDHCFVREGNWWHLFYTHVWTTQEPYQEIGHAISANMRDWQELSPVVQPGPGAPVWRSLDVWAPHVVPWPDGGYVMAFTGNNEFGAQLPGFLFSDDLITWEERPEYPPLVPSYLYYWWVVEGLSDGRDPHLVYQDSTWHLIYSVRALDGISSIGYATSPDLQNWTQHPPIMKIGAPWENPLLESPSIVEWNGEYILQYSRLGIHMLRADSLTGPWDASQAISIDQFGRGAEIYPYNNGLLFSRIRTNSCDPDLTFLRCDSLDTSGWPYVVKPLPALPDFEYTGDAFDRPTFGDAPGVAGQPTSGHQDLYWLSSRWRNQDPLDNGCSVDLGFDRTGVLCSQPFLLIGDTLSALISGAQSPDSAYVSVNDLCTGRELAKLVPTSETLTHVKVELGEYRGNRLYWRAYDRLTRPGGWLSVDHFEERTSGGLPAIEPLPAVSWLWPDGGEQFAGGAKVQVWWDTNHPAGIDSIVIYHSFDGGKTLIRDKFFEEWSNNFRWNVPDTLAFDVILRVVSYAQGVGNCADSGPVIIGVTTDATAADPGGRLSISSRGGGLVFEGSVPRHPQGPAKLEVFDLRGRRIATPWRGGQGEKFVVPAPVADVTGRRLASGIYFARLVHGGRVWTERYVRIPHSRR